MGRTVDLNINYDNDPPFSQAVRDNVDKLFAKCFGSLENDKVKIVWSKGLHAKDKLGKQKAHLWSDPSAVNYNLKSTFGGQVFGFTANGSTGDYSSNICPTNVNGDASAVSGGDADVAMANTIAHEIGFHGLAGDSDPSGKDPKGDGIIDRSRNTSSLCTKLGTWSPDVCKAMRSALGVT